MATNHTENYQLNLWEPGDSFLRSEFNENTQKIDAALGHKGNCRIEWGSYVGTGEKTVSLTLSAKPIALFVYGANGGQANIYKDSNQFFVDLCGMSTRLWANWSGSTVSWSTSLDTVYALNIKDNFYFYIAFYCTD